MSVMFTMSYQEDSAHQGTQISSLDLTFAQTRKKIHALIAKEVASDEQPLKIRMEGGSIDGSKWIKISNLANAKTIALWANIFAPPLSSASCQNQSSDKQPQKDPDNERIPVAITGPLDFESGQRYHIKVINRDDALTASFSLVEDPTQTDRADRERQFERGRQEGFEHFCGMMKDSGLEVLLESMKSVKFSHDSSST